MKTTKKTTKRTAECKCIEKVNETLSEQGVELETSFAMDFKAGKAKTVGPFLAVCWKDKPKPRGKRLPKVLCAYCPVCGKKK